MQNILEDVYSSHFTHSNTKIHCIVSEDLINRAYKDNPKLVDIDKSLNSKENEKMYLKIKKIDKWFSGNFKTPLNKFIKCIKIFTVMPNDNYDELGIDCFYNYNAFILKEIRVILGYNNYRYSLLALLRYCIYAYFIDYYEMIWSKRGMHIDNGNEINKRTLYLLLDFYTEYVFGNDIFDVEMNKRLKYFNKYYFRSLYQLSKRYSDQNDFIKYIFNNQEMFIDMINENYEKRKQVNLFSISNNERNDIQ